MWALAFASVWYAPLPTASWWLRFAHFTLATCTYDTMLTLVEVNHSALLAELSVDDAERASFNGYAAVFAGAGSLTSFAGHVFWDSANPRAFQLCCAVIALLCGVVFALCAETLRLVPVKATAPSPHALAASLQPGPVIAFLRELMQHGNFWVFAGVATVQSFDCAFEKTSFASALDPSLSKATRGALVSASFLLPWVGTLLVTPVIQRRGIYSVFRAVLALRLALCCAFVLARPALGAHALAGFLLANRVASETVCRISPLVLSDIVDEDRVLHKRGDDTPRAGSVIGAAHFISKFGSSAGPMLGFVLLSRTHDAAHHVMLGAVPLACVAAQSWAWARRFTLRGAYLARVKDGVAAGRQASAARAV